MRRLKVSFICILAALLCCAFALLFINIFNNAQNCFNTQNNPAAEITRPENNAQKTDSTQYSMCAGWTGEEDNPDTYKYSESYVYNNTTYYKTVTIPYTGSTAKIIVPGANASGPNWSCVVNPSGCGSIVRGSSNYISLTATAVGTYKFIISAGVVNTGTPAGDVTIGYVNGTNGGTDTTATLTVIIKQAGTAISPSVKYNSTMTYNGTQTLSVNGNTGGGAVTWTLTNGTGKATLSSTTAASPTLTATQAGTVKVKAAVAAKGNYLAGTTPEVTITINKASISPTLTYSTVTFGSNSATPTVGGNSGSGTKTFTVTNGTGSATINSSTGVLTPTQAGTVTVKVSIAATTNYAAGTKSVTVTINKANITPTLTYSTVTFGSNSATPTVGGNSGSGTKTFTVTNGTGSATINSSTGVITPTQAGTVTVTVSVAATTNYNAGTKSVTITINKAAISPTLTYSTVTFGSNSAAPTVGGNTGNGTKTFTVVAGTGKATINSSTGIITPTQAGTVTVTVSIAATTNYAAGTKSVTVTINKAAISPTLSYSTVTFGANSAAPTVGGNTGNGTKTFTVAEGTGKATINSSTGVITPTQAGTVTVTVSVAATTNYAAGSKTITVTINKANISPTLTYATVYYGITTAAPTVGGNSGNGTKTFTITNGSGEAGINASTGVLTPTKIGTVTVKISIAATTNYNAGSKEITVTINKAPLSLTLTYSTVMFGRNSVTPSLTGNTGNGTPTYTIANGTGKATIDATTGVISPTQAGTVTVTVSVPETTSYAAGTKSITVTINKADISLTLTYGTVTYGTNSAAPTFSGNSGNGAVSYSLANGTGTGTVNSSNGVITPTQAGTVSVTVAVAETTNYKAGTKTVTVTIDKATIAPVIDYGTVTYGTNSAVPTLSNAGNGARTFTVAGESGAATINANTGVITPTQAGTVKVTVSIAEATNYYAGSGEVTVTIDKAAVTPNFTYPTVTFGVNSAMPTITGNDGNTTPSWSVENGSGEATIDPANGILTPVKAGTVTVTLSLPSNTNYLAGSKTLTITIEKAAISPDLTYGRVTYSINSDAPEVTGNTENGAVSFMVAAGTGSATIDPDTGVLTPTKVGTVTVTLNIAATTNYAAGTKSVTVTINKFVVTEPKFDTASGLNSHGLVFTNDTTAKLVYTGAQVYIAVICPEGWATHLDATLNGAIDTNSWNASNGGAFVVTAARALAGSTHTVTFTLKNDNLEFANGGERVVLTLSITKQTVAVPSFDAGNAGNTHGLAFSNNDRTAIYEYSASQVYIAVTNVANWSLYMEAVLSDGIDGVTWASSAGCAFLVSSAEAKGGSNHTLTFNISDDNYVFDNGETTVILTLAITKAKLAVPSFNSLDVQNSKGITFSDAYKNATLGYTGNDVYIGVSLVEDWALYMGAELSSGINGTSWTAAAGKGVTVDAVNALAGTDYNIVFTITNDNYVFNNDETVVKLTFNITRKKVTDSDVVISLDTDGFTYNGLTQMPEITVAHTGALSAPAVDTDYTVRIANAAGTTVTDPTDAGTYTVVISGLGNYTGESSAVKFVISPAEISSTTVILEQTEYGYDGTAKTPKIEIKIGETVISVNYYTVKYANNTNAGTASVTLAGLVNLTGETVVEFTINKRDIAVVTFSDIAAQEYANKAYTPVPVVTDSGLGTVLLAGRDFEFSYEDNENAGTATVTVTATGNYTGTASTTFVINPRDITVVVIGAIENQSFDGTAKTPAPEISDYKIAKTLTEGVDFEFVYENNYDAGVATLYINGQNNYTGNLVFPFTINKRSLENAEFLSIDAQVYDGNPKTPTANITENGLTLRVGLDYNVSYTNNLNAGEATMTITGIGNYTGKNDFTFPIYARAFDNSFEIDGVRPSYVYTGSAITASNLTVTWRGKTLSSALDYDVTYSEGVNAGTTVLVTVSGKGNYTGSKLVEFNITQASLTVVPELKDPDKTLHAGWGLPDIIANVTFNGKEVSGILAWQKINGAEPKLFDYEHVYGWIFTPTGEDAINFAVATGEMTLYAEPVDVEKITVSLIGDRKTYRAFDKFDPTTITVVATLNDGTEIMIPKDYDVIYIDGRDHLLASDTYVTISHVTRGKTVTAEFSDFSVNRAIPTVNVTVDGTPQVGDKLSSVTLVFADGDTAGTYEWIAPETVLETGVHTFTYRFTPDDAVNYEVYEGAVEINLIIVEDMSVMFYQNSAELFTSDGLDALERMIESSEVQLTVKVFYSDNTSKTLTLNAEVDGYTLEISGNTLSEDGEVTVVCTYNGQTFRKTFNAQVTVIKIVRIEAELDESDLTVYTDTTLEELKSLITVTAYYNNDSSKTVEDFAVSFINGATKLTHGTAVISVDYSGDYKDEACQPVELTLSNVIKHQTEIIFDGITVYTYNGEEQTITSGAVLNHTQDAHIAYTIDGDTAAFTTVPAGGKLILTISAEETDDYYAATVEVVITVRKAQTVLDLSYVKRSYTYNGEEQAVTGALIVNGEDGAEIVYSNNTFKNVPVGGKLTAKISVAESENFLGVTEKVEVEVNKAKIDANGSGEKLYFVGDYLAISFDEKNEDGTYKNLLVAGGDKVKITYSGAYKVGEASIPEPEDEILYSAFKPELTGVGRYVVNVKIAATDDYETFYGQWLVEVEEGKTATATTDGETGVPVWLIAVFAACAVLSAVAILVAIISIRKKPVGGDNDGFYDDVDEAYLAPLN